MYRFRTILALAAVMAAAFVACREVVTLDDLVTDKVIEVAVASFAKDMQEPWSYAKSHGPTWTANMKARHAVFAEHLGEDWFNLYYSSPLPGLAMSIARESLDTPEELRAAYLGHKAKVIAEIREQGIAGEVVQDAIYALPFFSPPGSPSPPDPYGDRGVKEWAERRRAEGGDALVAAWGGIIADLANSL